MRRASVLTFVCVLAGALAFVWLASPIVAQAPAKTVNAVQSKSYVVPKTSWGDPDLQGLWPATDMINVPMQRAAGMGTRNVLTDEEFKARETAAARTAASDKEQFVKEGTKAGINPPSYWLEHGKPMRQASLVVDPPDGRTPPLTKQAQDASAKIRADRQARGNPVGDRPEDQSLYDRCISRGVMGSILPVIYNNGNQIIQSPGMVAIRYEMIHETRVIPLNGSPHVDQSVRSYMGDPRGHWDGNTLVVETTNFLGDKNGIGPNGGGTPHSTDMRLIERFTRVSDKTIQYEATIDDPKVWVKPWTVSYPLNRDDGFQVYEYACHEGNYGLLDILSGAREDEKRAAAEKAGKK
jgi:hypothetical protein